MGRAVEGLIEQGGCAAEEAAKWTLPHPRLISCINKADTSVRGAPYPAINNTVSITHTGHNAPPLPPSPNQGTRHRLLTHLTAEWGLRSELGRSSHNTDTCRAATENKLPCTSTNDSISALPK